MALQGRRWRGGWVTWLKGFLAADGTDDSDSGAGTIAPTETARMTFVVEIERAEQLDRAIRRIPSVPAVLRASRKR